ncbi:MAG: alpha/beta fold hydrolase [Acidimicrobiales bacterium]
MSGGAPRLPPGRPLDLPGRGTTFVRELAGPPGAPCVVLLHGWTVNADLNWFTAYRRLGEHFRVVAIDHRGHGRGIRARRQFRLADCADDVAAVCAALDIESCIPVGYSMGGPVAMLTWHRHRDLVDGLVLCATSSYFRGTGPERQLFTFLPVVAGAGRLTPRPLRQAIASRLLGGRTDDTPFGEWARTQIAQADPVAVAEAGASLGRFDARGWLDQVDVPTAIVRTTHDRSVPPDRQAELAATIPGARTIHVDADHAACVTAADRFVPALVRACAIASSPGRNDPGRADPARAGS